MQPFLTANWRYLAILNYVVDPRLITPLIPVGTEIDFENGETFLSVVGFLFLDTRLLGLSIPLHRDFEEVNLRFYVRRKSADKRWRGVVFIRELVPRRAMALVARRFYRENYLAVPMKHLERNVTTHYGEPFAEVLNQSPRFAFLADGSPITVQKRKFVIGPRCQTRRSWLFFRQ